MKQRRVHSILHGTRTERHVEWQSMVSGLRWCASTGNSAYADVRHRDLWAFVNIWKCGMHPWHAAASARANVRENRLIRSLGIVLKRSRLSMTKIQKPREESLRILARSKALVWCGPQRSTARAPYVYIANNFPVQFVNHDGVLLFAIAEYMLDSFHVQPALCGVSLVPSHWIPLALH